MVDLSNQVVYQKVENGFIITVQVKGSNNSALSFLGGSNVDKKHYVAKDKEELLSIIDKISDGLKSQREVEELIEKESLELE